MLAITITLAFWFLLVKALPSGWNDQTVFWNDPCIFRPSSLEQPQSHVNTLPSSATGSASQDWTIETSKVETSPPNACSSIAILVAKSQSASPSATPTVPAELGYNCLTSIPFETAAAVDLLDSLRPYIDWQTTLTYIKDPPTEYADKVQSPYDFWAVFESIYERAKTGSYANEYSFGWDLYEAFQATHDGHFLFLPDSIGDIMTFGRETPLVSISRDGSSLPEIYAYHDIEHTKLPHENSLISPVVKINGRNAIDFLLDWSGYGSLQDKDALWNNVFYSPAQMSLKDKGTDWGTFCGGGRGRWVYPGAVTTLQYGNGSSTTHENFARILIPFGNITSGEDIYNNYFRPPEGQPKSAYELSLENRNESSLSISNITTTQNSTASVVQPSPTSSVVASGFPLPVIREMHDLNSGYFLDSPEYDDIAVLSVPSFVDPLEDEIPFQDVNTAFLKLAIEKGKKKLIIDLSANAGGTILQGYDLFKQLFPNLLPYGASRFRAHEALDLIGQEVSYFCELLPRSLDNNETVRDLESSPLNFRTDVQKSYHAFPDWQTKYGPHEHHGDSFTSLMRWNLTDILTPDNSGGIYVSGYLNRSNITTAPFAPENIVIVTDGYCASTCSIFVELMTSQGGVKTIALGGRPNFDAIQAVGGVKGANDHTWHSVLSKAQIPFQYELLHDSEYYRSTALGTYNNLWSFRTSLALLNVRDSLLEGDDTLPAQFVYQPANCRVFYTAAMALNQSAVWSKVADIAFRGKSGCVAGEYLTD